MDDKNLNNMMENLNTPDPEPGSHKRILKIAILNSERSAAMGVWFVVVPLFFLFCVFMKYYFNLNLHFFDIIEEFISSMDKLPVIRYLTPVLFVGLPIISIIINSLSFAHFSINKPAKEVTVTFKIKWINILLVVISLGVVGIFILYVIMENVHHIKQGY